MTKTEDHLKRLKEEIERKYPTWECIGVAGVHNDDNYYNKFSYENKHRYKMDNDTYDIFFLFCRKNR